MTLDLADLYEPADLVDLDERTEELLGASFTSFGSGSTLTAFSSAAGVSGSTSIRSFSSL